MINFQSFQLLPIGWLLASYEIQSICWQKILFLLHSVLTVLTIFHWFLSVCRASSPFPVIWVLYEAIINLFKPVKLSKLLLYKKFQPYIDYNFLVYAEMLHDFFFQDKFEWCTIHMFSMALSLRNKKENNNKTWLLLMAKHWGE